MVTEMDTTEIHGAEQDQSRPKAVGKGEGTVVADEDAMEGVELCASDPGVLKGVRIQNMPKVDLKSKQAQVSNVKRNKGPLKDLTNVLEARPVNLKPAWVGPKNAKGSAVKGVGPVTDWVQHGPTIIQLGGGRVDNGGPVHTRPPDPSKRDKNNKALAATSSTQRSESEGSERNGAEVLSTGATIGIVESGATEMEIRKAGQASNQDLGSNDN